MRQGGELAAAVARPSHTKVLFIEDLLLKNVGEAVILLAEGSKAQIADSVPPHWFVIWKVRLQRLRV